MNEMSGEMLSDAMGDVIKKAVKESYEFSIFAVSMKAIAEEVLDSIVISEANKIATCEKSTAEGSHVSSSVMSEYAEAAVLKMIKEMVVSSMVQEKTLIEDSLSIAEKLIDQEIRSMASEGIAFC